jgi:hypothetical protein
MLGDVDYYEGDQFPALQVVPVNAHAQTVDIPDTSAPLDLKREKPWRWLVEQWSYPVEPRTLVLTDLDALRGEPITMVNREFDDGNGTQWEAWATKLTDIPREVVRAAPIGLFLALDPTLAPTLNLLPGEYAVRDTIDDSWRLHAAADDLA